MCGTVRSEIDLISVGNVLMPNLYGYTIRIIAVLLLYCKKLCLLFCASNVTQFSQLLPGCYCTSLMNPRMCSAGGDGGARVGCCCWARGISPLGTLIHHHCTLEFETLMLRNQRIEITDQPSVVSSFLSLDSLPTVQVPATVVNMKVSTHYSTALPNSAATTASSVFNL
jgi:hypothetical protein